MVEFLIVLLMAANTAATAITRERDDATMELLLVTPLTSKYIVWGKLRGLVSFAVPLMMVPAVTVMAVAFYDLSKGSTPPCVSLIQALILPALLSTYAALACMLGLQMSLKSKRSVQAVLASIGILIVAGFGLGLCALGATSATAQVGAIIAPLTFVTSIYFVLNPEAFVSGAPVVQFHVLMAIGTLIAVALYGAVVAGTYRSMVANFDMVIRKQSK
jgi:ABC-type transport system involved in multi-copper enzyme maturation permease subunit